MGSVSAISGSCVRMDMTCWLCATAYSQPQDADSIRLADVLCQPNAVQGPRCVQLLLQRL
eukprot:352454-Chlamydomonas_euryale.AAC.5